MNRPDPVQAVIDAWADAGPAPDYHHAAQARLIKEWPVLARALVALVAAAVEREDRPAGRHRAG